MRRTRAFIVTGILAALLVAGVVSYYASSSPDGLEHVAEQAGFAETARDHAGADGPLADYSTKGVDDPRLSGGVAGVTGALVTLAVTAGLVLVVRRRSPDRHADPTSPRS